jgi:hypothetical protein
MYKPCLDKGFTYGIQNIVSSELLSPKYFTFYSNTEDLVLNDRRTSPMKFSGRSETDGSALEFCV